eukprot:COSAG04_NODE_2598_length_3870_cov_7.079024_1_plen_263_part_10
MSAATVALFVLALIALISLRGGLCTILPTDNNNNNNIHYNSTLTPAKGGFSSVTSVMAAKLSGCSKSMIDDQHENDNQGRQPKDGLPQLLDDIIPIYSFLPVGTLAMGAGVLPEPGGDAALSLQLPFLNKLSKSFSSITILLCSIFAHESLQQSPESANSTLPLIAPVYGEIHPSSEVRCPFYLPLSCMCIVLLLCFCFLYVCFSLCWWSCLSPSSPSYPSSCCCCSFSTSSCPSCSCSSSSSYSYSFSLSLLSVVHFVCSDV